MLGEQKQAGGFHRRRPASTSGLHPALPVESRTTAQPKPLIPFQPGAPLFSVGPEGRRVDEVER